MQAQSYVFNPQIMGVDVMKQQLIERIQQGDEQLVRVLFAVSEALEETENEAEEVTDEMINAIPAPPWPKLSPQDLKAELDGANAEIESGEFITLEELEKEAEQW